MMNLEVANDSEDETDPRKTSVLIHEDQELEDPFRVLIEDDSNHDFKFASTGHGNYEDYVEPPASVWPSLNAVSAEALEDEARRHFEEEESPRSLPDLTAPPSPLTDRDEAGSGTKNPFDKQFVEPVSPSVPVVKEAGFNLDVPMVDIDTLGARHDSIQSTKFNVYDPEQPLPVYPTKKKGRDERLYTVIDHYPPNKQNKRNYGHRMVMSEGHVPVQQPDVIPSNEAEEFPRPEYLSPTAAVKMDQNARVWEWVSSDQQSGTEELFRYLRHYLEGSHNSEKALRDVSRLERHFRKQQEELEAARRQTDEIREIHIEFVTKVAAEMSAMKDDKDRRDKRDRWRRRMRERGQQKKPIGRWFGLF